MVEVGSSEGPPKRLSPEREHEFKAMVAAGYTVTSDETRGYNCIAHAAGDSSNKWDPCPPYYWPDTSKLSPLTPLNIGDDAVELVQAFRSLEYEICQGGDLEDGYEKVALYVKDGEWAHAAKQLSNGQWSSKLGDWEDVMHRTAHCFGDSTYGDVLRFMKRKIKPSDKSES